MMNTRIRVLFPKETKIKGKLEKDIEWIDIGNKSVEDEPKYRYCEWKNSHGNDYLISDSKIATNKPKIKLRYDPRINSRCRILKDDDERYFQIIGEPDNINEANQWLEIRLERLTSG